jgi:bifunctional non-homologous end joining protein LigD
VPTGAGWAYEIKHDGFRFICRRDGERVRCYSRGGYDWSRQLPGVVEAMRALPVTSVTLDGEIVICGADGVSQFECPPCSAAKARTTPSCTRSTFSNWRARINVGSDGTLVAAT